MPPKKTTGSDAGNSTITTAGTTPSSANVAAGTRSKRTRAKAVNMVASTRVTRSKAAAVASATPMPPSPVVHGNTIQVSAKSSVTPHWELRRKTLFEDLALDVLVEIFAATHPRDLLALARTSKPFRAFLMSRKSAQCWKAARELSFEGAPACPPFLSEPQYASLMFIAVCESCGAPAPGSGIWEFFVRYCQSCKCLQLRHSSDLDTLLRLVQRVCNDTEQSDTRFLAGHYAFAQSFEGWGWLSGTYYHAPEIKRFREAWAACKTVDEKKQLVKRCTAVVAERATYVAAIKEWGDVEAQREVERRKEATKTRITEVFHRLRKEGWGEELDRFNDDRREQLRRLPSVSKAEVLTEDEWQGMRGALNTQMEVFRDARHKEEWFVVARQRLVSLCHAAQAHDRSLGPRDATSDLRAEFADLVLMPTFRQVLEAPKTVNVTKDDIAKLCETIPTIREAWLQTRQQEFKLLVARQLNLGKSASPLSLAIVTFYCSACKREGLRWPNVLAHRCGRGPAHADYYQRSVTYVCEQLRLTLPWCDEGPFMANAVPEQMQAMIRLCGQNPSSVTLQEMQSCNVRLYCTICSVPEVGFMEVFDWRNTKSHSFPRCDIRQTLFGPPQSVKANKWAILDAKTTEAVLVLEAAQRAAGDVPDGIYGCTRCYYRSRGFPLKHCAQAHGIRKPKIDQDFYLHPETPDSSHPILVYPEGLRRDRTPAMDVKQGRALFSTSLFSS